MTTQVAVRLPAEQVKAIDDLVERGHQVRVADIGGVVRVMAHHRERDFHERSVVEGEAGQHADPVPVAPAAMPGVEREAAKTVENRLALTKSIG